MGRGFEYASATILWLSVSFDIGKHFLEVENKVQNDETGKPNASRISHSCPRRAISDYQFVFAPLELRSFIRELPPRLRS